MLPKGDANLLHTCTTLGTVLWIPAAVRGMDTEQGLPLTACLVHDPGISEKAIITCQLQNKEVT